MMQQDMSVTSHTMHLIAHVQQGAQETDATHIRTNRHGQEQTSWYCTTLPPSPLCFVNVQHGPGWSCNQANAADRNCKCALTL